MLKFFFIKEEITEMTLEKLAVLLSKHYFSALAAYAEKSGSCCG